MLIYLDPNASGNVTLTPSEVVDCNGYDAYYKIY